MYFYIIPFLLAIINKNKRDIMEKIIIISSIVAILFIFKHIKTNFILYSTFTFPATFIHEVSHLIISLILNGRPITFKVFPKRIEKKDIVYYELGSVTSTNITWYNSLFIGLSPFLLWIGAYFLYISINGDLFTLINIGKIILIALLIEGGFPSIPDYKIAFSKSFIYIGILMAIIYFNPEYISIFWENIKELFLYLETLSK